MTPANNGGIYVNILCGFEREHWVHPHLLEFVLRLMHNSGRAGGFNVELTKPADFARNVSIQKFLKTNLEFYLTIDNDQLPPFNLHQILDRAESYMDVLTPMYFTRQRTATPGQNATVLCWTPKDVDADPNAEWRELIACGSGSLIVRRHVLEAMGEAWFRFEYGQNGEWLAGEDESFCRRAKELKFRIFGNTRFVSEHFHTASMNDFAQLQGYEFMTIGNWGADYRTPVDQKGNL